MEQLGQANIEKRDVNQASNPNSASENIVSVQNFVGGIAPVKLCYHHQPYFQDPESSNVYLASLI